MAVIARPRGQYATAGMQGGGTRRRKWRLLLDDGDRAMNRTMVDEMHGG
jgi:hypothetical protein